eukprot:gene20632-21306_t
MMPVEVEMRVGWSDSTGGFEGYSVTVYEALQALQQARQPFEVATGKRLYTDMLIASLEVSTNASAEYALMARVVLREVIIVGTQTTSTGIASDPANQAEPQTTAPPVSAGTQQPSATTIDPGAFAPGGSYLTGP